jgi:hypothetical protein
VPELAAPALEARVARAVESAIAERRRMLVELVEARIGEELDRLAAELVEQRLAAGNGYGRAADDAAASSTPTLELCVECGQGPRLGDRRRCPRCRNAHARELRAARRAKTPVPAASTSRRARPNVAARAPSRADAPSAQTPAERAELDEWLVAEGFARRGDGGELQATARGRELGGGID